MMTKVVTDRGIIELDLERIAVDILSQYGRSGATDETIATEVTSKYHTQSMTSERIHEILETVKFARYDGERWRASSNAVLSLIKQRARNEARSKSGRFKVKVRYTKEGWARIIVPTPIIDKLGKPDSLYITMADNVVKAGA